MFNRLVQCSAVGITEIWKDLEILLELRSCFSAILSSISFQFMFVRALCYLIDKYLTISQILI